MAPEILLTKPYNHLVDIWSLGIIMLELAEGINPYRGMTLSRIMYAMKNEKAPRIKNKDKKTGIEFKNKVLVEIIGFHSISRSSFWGKYF